MHDAWTVLGGWGVEPDVLRPVFGGQSMYIDTNRLFLQIVDDNKLRSDWQERCAALIAPHLRNTGRLAGWSTGAIIAFGCCGLLQPAALVLISPTFSFCRTPEYRYGMRPAVLAAMRNQLSTNTHGVLREFRTRCGLPDAAPDTTPWPAAELDAGLQALAGITLTPPPAVPGAAAPFIVHGRSDAIIPFAAGEQVHRLAGGCLLALDAPHACFVNNEKTVKSAIDHYLKETNHESV